MDARMSLWCVNLGNMLSSSIFRFLRNSTLRTTEAASLCVPIRMHQGSSFSHPYQHLLLFLMTAIPIGWDGIGIFLRISEYLLVICTSSFENYSVHWLFIDWMILEVFVFNFYSSLCTLDTNPIYYIVNIFFPNIVLSVDKWTSLNPHDSHMR